MQAIIWVGAVPSGQLKTADSFVKRSAHVSSKHSLSFASQMPSTKFIISFESKLSTSLCIPRLSLDSGDWSNGMIGVSKTFGGSSILSSPVFREFNVFT